MNHPSGSGGSAKPMPDNYSDPGRSINSIPSGVGLSKFIKTFFRPIISDLVIYSSEETALYIGFYIYKIHDMPQETVVSALSTELAVFKNSLPAKPPPPTFQDWWDITERQVVLPSGDFICLSNWFLRIATLDDTQRDFIKKQRQDTKYADVTARISSDIYKKYSEMFYLFKSANGALLKFLEADQEIECPSTVQSPESTPASIRSVNVSAPLLDVRSGSHPIDADISNPASVGLEAIVASTGPSPEKVVDSEEARPTIADPFEATPVETIASRLTILAAYENLKADLWRDAFDIVGQLLEKAGTERTLGLAFDDLRKDATEKVIFIKEESLKDQDIWFVGDIHGDHLGLEAALDGIRQVSEDPLIVFLGDFIDRGISSPEVLLRIFQLIHDRPARTCLLAGNHSDAVGLDDRVVFHSAVSPGNFVNFLNSKGGNELWRQFGESFVKASASLPRALFFPDGLLAAHGGIPHTDLHGSIQERADLNREGCLQDFVWTRAKLEYKKRWPNRNSKGCSFGLEDFNDFCRLMTERVNFPVRRMVRGHDHMEERFDIFEKNAQNQMLTINNMCHRMPDEPYGEYQRTPCVARWRRGKLPAVYRIMLDPAVLNAVSPEPQDG